MLLEVDPTTLSGHCQYCGVPVIAAGDPADTSPVACERCAADGYPGVRGHALPDYAIAFARATGAHLNAAVCTAEAQAWSQQAYMFECVPDQGSENEYYEASIAASRDHERQMLIAALAFRKVQEEVESSHKSSK